jgi:hypothetical protein
MRKTRISFFLVMASLVLAPLAAAAQQTGAPPKVKDKAQIKGRAFGSPLARGLYSRASTAEVDPLAKPGAPAAVEAAVSAQAAPAQEAKPAPALTRDVNTRLSTAEADPQAKPGAPAAVPPAAKKPAAKKAEVKRTEPIVPAYSGIKEKTAVFVFYVWLWFAIAVMIYFLRLWIKEADRVYWAKYYEPEESPRKDNPLAPVLGD